ncbi:hypothetical protein GF351_01365 [Candidatus Woesearchaeota archaeon]|nr:hypothetical protein [Candidatus Woesearchaeota archaeon]
MFFQLIIAIGLGTCAGIVTGLIPGIHINLISMILLTISAFLLKFTSPLVLAVFIITMAVTHTFLDTIPSIFLGAPDSDTVMSVLPGHRMLLQGKGYEAVKLTVIGSLLSLILCILFIPLFIPFIPFAYEHLQPLMGVILLAMVMFMIWKESSSRNRLWASAHFLLAGSLGLIVLNFPNLSQPLFPMLSGLFGTSTLVMSLTEKVNIPGQEISETIEVSRTKLSKSLLGATLSGSLVSFFPGMGAAQAAVLSSTFLGNLGAYAFMILVGGINTVNMTVSLATLYTLDKARNGAVLVVQEIISALDASGLVALILTAFVAGGLATVLAFRITRVFSRWIVKVDYQKLCMTIILLITVLVFFFSGYWGLLVLLISTFVGMIPGMIGIKRSHSMACLLLPVILFFLL